MSRWIAIAAVLAALVVLPHGLRNYGVYLLSLWAVYAVAALGLNLTVGYAGQVSLAQAAGLGIGAIVSALLLAGAAARRRGLFCDRDRSRLPGA